MLYIKRATLDDASKITEIKTQAFNKEINYYLGRDGGPEGYNKVSSEIDIINNFIAYKILLGEEIIGCFFLRPITETHIFFEDFCINPIFQNKGYGYKTLQLIKEKYPEIKKWSLHVAKFSLKNQHLYKKFGFVQIGENEWEYKYMLEC